MALPIQNFGAWKGVVGQRHAPAALPSERHLVPIVQGGAPRLCPTLGMLN